MNRKPVTIAAVVGLALTGCGAAAGLVATAPASAKPATDAKAAVTLVHSPSTPTPAPPTPTAATPTPAPSAPPRVSTVPAGSQVVVLADEDSGSASFEVALVSLGGRVVASTQVAQDARWTIGNGPGAAYWVSGGRLQRLSENGKVTTLTTVPSTESGRVVVSPDGSQWAYATTAQSAQGMTADNRIYRQSAGQAAHLVAERTSDPSHQTADAPPSWQYYLLSWTSRGILIERQPTGGCGCGTPFDMQMTAGYAAYIDPVTGMATPLGATPSCPLSGVGADGTLACFHTTANGASDRLQLMSGTQVTGRIELSGTTDGGDATFNGTTLAYATVPDTAGGCGGPDWRPETTLRLMNTTTGSARPVGGLGLEPAAWLSDGQILATLSSAHAGVTTSTVVVVDPTSGAVHTLFGNSFTVIGLG